MKKPIKQCAQMNVMANGMWFLDEKPSSAEKSFSIQSNGLADDCSFYNPAARPALIFPMLNGERTFSALYDAIYNAKCSIEIVCWAFQPSFYLKRTHNSLALGPLLETKAKSGVNVKILCYSMAFGLQNLGPKDLVNMPHYVHSGLPKFLSARIGELGSLTKIDINWWENYHKIENLTFETHDAGFWTSSYIDKVFTRQWLALLATSTNHQKTVLIDFDVVSDPKKAEENPDVIPSGFILGHNFLDSYWDNDQHLYHHEMNSDSIEIACKGKNFDIPLQDVSYKIYGAPLALLKKNSDELWVNKIKEYQSLNITEEMLTKLTQTLNKAPTCISAANDTIQGHLLHAQILRTYRKRHIKDIARLYIKNIRNTTQFVYTENQYFRWPVLVNALKESLERGQTLTDIPESKKVYWFATTNSSDTGLGSGTANTDRMLDSLGRRNQMPSVARNLDWEPFKENQELEKQAQQLSQQQKEWEQKDKNKSLMSAEEKEMHEKQKHELDFKQFELYKNQETDILMENGSSLQSIVCTLIAAPSDGIWRAPYQETYIHSKCTIINDVMAVSGSANLNTRSMEVDTEIAMLTESEEYATHLRQSLWQVHAKSELYPFATYQNKEIPLKLVFRDWTDMAKKNIYHEYRNIPPNGRLKWFFRTNTTVSYLD